MWYLIVMIPDICTLTYFELMMHNMLRERLGGELVLYKGLACFGNRSLAIDNQVLTIGKHV